MPYFRGQGKVYIAKRDATTGQPKALRYVGKTAGLKVGLATETLERKESETGNSLTALRLSIGKSATVDLTIEEFTKENLALALYATPQTVVGSTVTGEVLLPTVMPAVGDFLRTQKANISSVVVTDSTGTPKTLTAGTNYRVSNPSLGTIEILDITTGAPFVAPLKAAYTYGAATLVPMFDTATEDLWVRFEGLNTADTNKPVLIELYRCSFSPMSELNAKGNEVNEFALSGGLLYDDIRTLDAALGQFGRVVLV